MFAPQATAPTTLPTHTIPLNNPSCPHAPSNPPALAQRKHHIPLYNAATPNKTICSTRQPHRSASGAARASSSKAKRTLHLQRRCCRRSRPAAAGTACGRLERSKLWTSRSCPWGGWRGLMHLMRLFRADGRLTFAACGVARGSSGAKCRATHTATESKQCRVTASARTVLI